MACYVIVCFDIVVRFVSKLSLTFLLCLKVLKMFRVVGGIWGLG